MKKVVLAPSLWQDFLIFLRLGLTAFGGPIAHLGYFRQEFVDRRRWLDEHSYAQLVALCQFLPGPASSQLGMALGLARHGYCGALAAWAGFTLPSAILLIAFARYVASVPAGVLHGLKVMAVAVVAQAVLGMARSLCPDARRFLIMLGAAVLASWKPTAVNQIVVLLAAAVAGWMLCKPQPACEIGQGWARVSRRYGGVWLALFFVLLVALPLATAWLPWPALSKINAFYQAGALVFGGGHVVLPWLQTSVVASGWVSEDIFVAGYAATQALPGPLFCFAAYLGASMNTGLSAWASGVLCLLAIFAPAFLVLAGVLPFWQRLRAHAPTQAAWSGVNAAVVGLLLAALVQPIGVSALHAPADFLLAALAFMALTRFKRPPWQVVLGCAFSGWMIGSLT